MNSDPNQPPIPSPFEPLSGEPQSQKSGSDWNDAPKIVKNWAYPLTWLTIIVSPLAILAVFVGEEAAHYTPESKLFAALLYLIAWASYIWLNRALKRGAPLAWNVQFVFSVLGLCGFPLGTFINIYILTNWFSPATKAWFNRR